MTKEADADPASLPEQDAPEPAAPLSREEILAYYARTGYSLDHHPAHIIRRAHQRATACFQEVMAGDDLTPTQHAAIATILRYGEVSQNHLGRLTRMDPSTISLVVRALLKRGLIERRPSKTDQRMATITLTPHGVRYGLERLDSSMEVARRLLAPLSATEQATLLELLRRIAADEDGPSE
ncbi:MarR family winged helix-turn-helix transcriptional regulator [Labrys wisconsinensis]|uniref:DNA-binding MarR family transcriptional regulator n=1 Tax=Labrys wisconsinensis TaxID=425677 RepID=A0ABU0J877_9HYPH|nr:MarR family winged helix-turn-helix transcriptional regulator [Labrys wisconsinensis]MDQ0470485.1 DNA-binding MarR family transcriptional regulator [Labrys wisconsinensis]